MDAIVALPLGNSNWGKPQFKIDDYDTYTSLHEFMPREHFEARAQSIHEAVARSYPTPLFVYVTFAITSFVTIMLVSVAVVNVSGVFDVNYLFLPMLLVLAPVTLGVLLRFRQTHYEGKFEIALVAVLKDFNTQDITAHSIKWAFRKRDVSLRLGPPYRILLLQADLEAEVDTLPAYEGTHQDIVVLMSPEDEMEGHDDRLPSSSSTSALPHYNQTLQMRLIQSSPRPSATMSETERTVSAAVSVELDREPTMVAPNQASPSATESSVTVETVDSAPVPELGMRTIERPPPLVVREEPPGYDVVIQINH
ncbi:hypothetical protein BC937DRAFT_88024 [Endogone sp. FLAS-F59071]|nr:hypothetical protein BC937DRAFT_88024 [Endogone sp. FLAS-F59071]|eukprot:RUS22665.1 hypothetical protein BC937DRAFT_88024 [Endogone sp. FLAS-F59071]